MGPRRYVVTKLDEHRVLFVGRLKVRRLASSDEAEIEEECFWVSTWVQGLLVALVAALAVLASEVAFGWVGRALVVAWKLMVTLFPVLGLGAF